MGDELKWLLKGGDGPIFENCDVSFKNTPTSHAVTCSLALFVYACSDPALLLGGRTFKRKALFATTLFEKGGWAYFREIMVIGLCSL